LRILSSLEKTSINIVGKVNILNEDFSHFYVVSESTKIEPGKEKDIRNSMTI
jgi:hypothetical protein